MTTPAPFASGVTGIYTLSGRPRALTLFTRAALIIFSFIEAKVGVAANGPSWIAYICLRGVESVARALALDVVDVQREHSVGRSQSVASTTQHGAEDED
jgi:hypothetical protein